MTLAMVSYDSSPTRTPAVGHNNSVVNLLCYEAPVPHFQSDVTALKFGNSNTTIFSFDSYREKQSISNQHDLLQLVHKKLYADGRMGKWVDVAAGYGQVCQSESSVAKNTADLQRPGFAYLKASFSF